MRQLKQKDHMRSDKNAYIRIILILAFKIFSLFSAFFLLVFQIVDNMS